MRPARASAWPTSRERARHEPAAASRRPSAVHRPSCLLVEVPRAALYGRVSGLRNRGLDRDLDRAALLVARAAEGGLELGRARSGGSAARRAPPRSAAGARPRRGTASRAGCAPYMFEPTISSSLVASRKPLHLARASRRCRAPRCGRPRGRSAWRRAGSARGRRPSRSRRRAAPPRTRPHFLLAQRHEPQALRGVALLRVARGDRDLRRRGRARAGPRAGRSCPRPSTSTRLSDSSRASETRARTPRAARPARRAAATPTGVRGAASRRGTSTNSASPPGRITPKISSFSQSWRRPEPQKSHRPQTWIGSTAYSASAEPARPLDHACPTISWPGREPDRRRQLAAPQVQVGAADPAGGHAQAHPVRRERRRSRRRRPRAPTPSSAPGARRAL